jgi:hypothetical protein
MLSRPCIASQRISAFVPRTMNRSSGVGGHDHQVAAGLLAHGGERG